LPRRTCRRGFAGVYPKPDLVDLGLEALRTLGYTPQPSDSLLTRGPLYFAGTPEMRLRDLHHAFADDDVRAIFATRGGYGSNYLLEGLDLDLISESAKPFIGFSDLTAPQLWLLDQIQLPLFTVHDLRGLLTRRRCSSAQLAGSFGR